MKKTKGKSIINHRYYYKRQTKVCWSCNDPVIQLTSQGLCSKCSILGDTAMVNDE